MPDPFLGEVRMYAGSSAPDGWEICDGRSLAIADNPALFDLIGTTYGGNGETDFGLPDLRGRVPIHRSPSYPLGQHGGVEEVQLTPAEMPGHTHAAMGAAITGDQTSPAGQLPANSVTITPYRNAEPDSAFNAQVVSPQGGDQPHENMQPYQCVNFIISLDGVFPRAGEE